MKDERVGLSIGGSIIAGWAAFNGLKIPHKTTSFSKPIYIHFKDSYTFSTHCINTLKSIYHYASNNPNFNAHKSKSITNNPSFYFEQNTHSVKLFLLLIPKLVHLSTPFGSHINFNFSYLPARRLLISSPWQPQSFIFLPSLEAIFLHLSTLSRNILESVYHTWPSHFYIVLIKLVDLRLNQFTELTATICIS